MNSVARGAPIIRFLAVAAGYRGVPVFQDLAFSLRRREGVCLVGKNGCGKSTVLRSVLRLAEILSGTIEFDGSDVRRIQRSEFARLGVGYVPQGRGDFPSLTVEENIRLAAQCDREASATGAIERVVAELPAIAPLRSRLVGQLSGGERTLVALARAVALQSRPRLLLLDEVSSGLSAANAECVRSILLRLRGEGAALLMAEQNIAFAQSLGIPVLEPPWRRKSGAPVVSAEAVS